jgi:osmotically inducible protein OsmC
MMKTVTFERSAEVEWQGDVVRGSGSVRASSDAFKVAVSFPTLRGEPPATTSPEELLAASHAACFGIGLRSVLARNGGSASRIRMTATITAEKGGDGIRVRGSHLHGVVEGLNGVDVSKLAELGRRAEAECTISTAIRGNVEITIAISAS